MAVYVDPLFNTKPNQKWPYRTACHMWADTSDELDEMAEQLGLAPHHKQNPFDPEEHYDLVGTKREQAIDLGAREVDWREFPRAIERKRGVPDAASAKTRNVSGGIPPRSESANDGSGMAAECADTGGSSRLGTDP